MRLSFVLFLLAVVAGPALAEVDRRVVGTWHLVEPANSGLQWEIRADETYEVRQHGVLLHAGVAEFEDGRWTIRSPVWNDGGTYDLEGETVRIVGILGPGTWSREKGASRQATTPPQAPATAAPVAPARTTPPPAQVQPAVALAMDILEVKGIGPPDPSKTVLRHYLDGLAAMRDGQFPEAAAAFSRAFELGVDDPALILARGIALTLAERFDQAFADLGRYKRLGGRGREADLWTHVAEKMSGRLLNPSHGAPVIRSLRKPGEPTHVLMGVPGHIIQGGKDYPTDYASFVYYEMATPYGDARANGRLPGNEAVFAAMAKAGRWFADRNMTRPELAPFHLARARRSLADGDYRDALTFAGFARDASPADPEIAYVVGESWLRLGRPATARREFTVALTGRTDFAEAYLGRALSAARQGDARRADADLKTARALTATAAEAARRAVAAELAEHRVADEPEALLSGLEAAAASGAALDRLVALAVDLHKAMSGRRLRYDEIYQDRMRELVAVVRAEPRDPDRWVALAKYMTDEVNPRGESVEPRRDLVPYRWQESAEAELARALAIANQALALNPRHVRALMQKAAVLARLDRDGEAERLAEQALAIAPNDPEALTLYALYKGRRANALNEAAAALRQDSCSSNSWTENRSDGVYEVTRTTCRPPSASDIARAKALDAQAAELRRRSRAAMQRAIDATRGTYRGYLVQAEAHVWAGEPEQAVAAVEEAIRLDPDLPEAQETLLHLYKKLGWTDEAAEQRIVVDRFFQTTAAPMLEKAWNDIARTAWQGARKSLARARGLDPEDARTPAYAGVALENEGRVAEARAAFLTALALEEARLSLDEPASHPGEAATRDIQEYGLLVRMRGRLASLLARAGDSASALALYRSSTATTARFAPGWRARQMFSAMVPDPDLPQHEKPAPVNGATLMAATHMNLGRMLKAAGEAQAAIGEFEAAAALGPRQGIPNIGTGRPDDSNFAGNAGAAATESLVELAEQYLRQGDLDRARETLQRNQGGPMSDEARARLNRLHLAIAKLEDERRERERFQPQPQQQRMAQGMLGRLPPVDRRFVGTWDMKPENQYLPSARLSIGVDGGYALDWSDGTARRGRLGMVANGVLMLVEDGGFMNQFYLEPTGPDRWVLTDGNSGVKYDFGRRR